MWDEMLTEGTELIDAEKLRRFWKYIYNLYVNEMGMKNLIWVYGPNVRPIWANFIQDVRYYYPGDEYCDIVGIDWYTGNKGELTNAGHSYDKLMSLEKYLRSQSSVMTVP